MKILSTLCIIHQHPRVLLGMKKRGFGEGKWNGFGGKVIPGETIEKAAEREMFEEAGVEVANLEKIGILEFEFHGKPDFFEMHIFRTDSFTGKPIESEEMRPQWFHVDEIPYKEMWPDDPYWIPLFLERKKFKGKYLFGESDTILEQTLEEMEEFSESYTR